MHYHKTPKRVKANSTKISFDVAKFAEKTNNISKGKVKACYNCSSFEH
jgi:hypothetical protein